MPAVAVRITYCTSFIFFFKQKTAYEMRISDWSSDVCSSDLALGFVVKRGESALAANLTGQGVAELGHPFVQRSFRVTGFGAVEKIGRASCRERVCQYV